MASAGAAVEPMARRRAVHGAAGGFVLTVLATLGAAQAGAPDGAAIRFTAAQMGTPLQGSFRDFAAVIDFDPEHPQHGSVHAQVAVASVSAGSREADELLRSSGFFDTAHFAQANFDAEAFEPQGAGRYQARGTFTLKGHTVRLPIGFTIAAGPQGRWYDGSFAISRLEFAVGQGEWSDTSTLDDKVEVQFHLLQARAAP